MHLRKYLENQIQEALVYKWIESQKAGKDLGETAVREWITKYSSTYRTEYNMLLNEMICKIFIKANDPNISLESVEKIIKLFTEEWAVENAKSNKNKHINEL